MEDTDFDLLCKGLTPDEAKRLRKLFREWSGGDENGFLVQLALLTTAQWNAAAAVPQAVNDSRKLIERHLAEYRQQTKGLIDGFAVRINENSSALSQLAEVHIHAVQEATAKIGKHSAAVELVARLLTANFFRGCPRS